MTDNEIIKALECCISGKPCEEIKCPLYKTDCEPDLYALEKYALDLINRLQAENERLTTLAKLGNMRANDYREMRDKLKKANAEIERLNKEVDRLSQCVLYHEGQIVDAVKDFAERLKERYIYVTPNEIDNLVKEMSNCKFNHEGMCCNCGSPQFKKECNVPCDCRECL